MDSCIVWAFSCLSYFGFRNWLLKKFAFRNHPLPTYTFRSQEFEQLKKANKESLEDTKLQLPDSKLTSRTETVIDCGIDGDSKSHLRIHRISSAIIEQDSRIYKVPNKISVFSNQYKSASKCASSIIDRQNMDSVSELNEVQLYKPKDETDYPWYSIKLINAKKEIKEVFQPDDIDIKGYYLTNKFQSKFAALVVQLKFVKSSYCLIHSHGNNPDLGIMIDSYLDLCFNLELTVIGYDYPGYGQTEVSPDRIDDQAVSNLEAAYRFAHQQLGFSWSKILLYGQSLGSGPSIAVATISKYPIGGLIIHSGLKSGLRVIKPTLKKTPKYDFFPNIDLIEQVVCKVMILHGMDDIQIDVQQAADLDAICKEGNIDCKLIKILNAGHNNIEFEENFRREYFSHLQSFVMEIKVRNRTISEKQLEKDYRSKSNSMQQRKTITQTRKKNGTSGSNRQNTQSIPSEIELSSSGYQDQFESNTNNSIQSHKEDYTRTFSVQNKKQQSQDNILQKKVKTKSRKTQYK